MPNLRDHELRARASMSTGYDVMPHSQADCVGFRFRPQVDSERSSIVFLS